VHSAVTRKPRPLCCKAYIPRTDTDTDNRHGLPRRLPSEDRGSSRGSRRVRRARKSTPAAPRQSACCGERGPFSSQTCPRTFVRRALFLARMSVGDARVYTCTCTVHNKLSCTRLQNYTIGASLKSVSVSVPMEFKLNNLEQAYKEPQLDLTKRKNHCLPSYPLR